MQSESQYAIEARGLGKKYRFYGAPHRRIFEYLSMGRWRGHRELWALRHLDLRVKPGSVLGVCGQNGAGKSTLLRILSGTTAPSEGRYRINGRVNGMLDLGAGVQPEASGRANILFQGLLLGWERNTMRKKADEIIEFSQLEDFIDEPLRTYSSGMAMRLAFSVAALMDPDVLILDEVFAVGDVAFQKRCIDRIHDIKAANKTIVFCSHSMYDLRQLCDEAIWLRDGQIAAGGEVVSVSGDYLTYMREKADVPALLDQPAAPGSLNPLVQPTITETRMCRPGSSAEVDKITTGDSVELHVWWRNPLGKEFPLHLGVALVREDGVVCVGLASHFDRVKLEGSAGRAVLRLPQLQLLSGSYLTPVWLLDETGTHRYQEFIPEKRLTVSANSSMIGVYSPEHEWVLEESQE